MRRHEVTGPVIVSLLAFTAVIITVTGCGTTEMRPMPSAAPAAMDATLSNSRRMVEEGRRSGGSGGGSPKTALAVGLKGDSEALPASLVDQIKKGAVDHYNGHFGLGGTPTQLHA